MNNFMNAAVFDLDVDGGQSTDLPELIRAVLNRTLNGGRPNKKTASERVIKSLQDLPLLSIAEKECPICYEPYEEKLLKRQREKRSSAQLLIDESNDFYLQLRHGRNDFSVQTAEEAQQFNDPSLFFADDQTGSTYTRFPMRNITTLQDPSAEEVLPGSVSKEERLKQEIDEAGHTPVKMPSCEHIFGRACIVQWLKSSVSCPLCRSEVEVQKHSDPRIRKAEEIRENIEFHYNDHESAVTHLAYHLTDVFRPYRRPYTPHVTSLTDSFIPQATATPSNSIPVGVQEPEIVIPRPFPVGEGPILVSHTVPIATIHEPRVRAQASQAPRQSPPATATNTDRSGGPDRTRRSPAALNRGHPYTRPSS